VKGEFRLVASDNMTIDGRVMAKYQPDASVGGMAKYLNESQERARIHSFYASGTSSKGVEYED